MMKVMEYGGSFPLIIKGKCVSGIIASAVWPLKFFITLSVYRPINSKKRNKLLTFIFGLLESVGIYLLGLFLDTTGIGNKILAFLLYFPEQLIQGLLGLFF